MEVEITDYISDHHTREMERTIPGGKYHRIWTAVFLLLAAAIITAAIVLGIIVPRFSDHENSIDIESDSSKHVIIRKGEGEGYDGETAKSYAIKHPGIEVEDEKGVVWTSTIKRVEIFHLRYHGDDGYSITVESSDKDRLVAPGTSNSYDFKVKNTGETNLNYTLTAETETRGGMKIPIEIRLKRGKRLVNKSGIAIDKKGWADFDDFSGTTDSGSLRQKNTVSYTLDWKWPFGQQWEDKKTEDKAKDNFENSSKKDFYDTLIGNMAVGEDLTVTVNLYILASYDNPKTGDNSNLMIWIGIFAAALCLLLGILLLMRKRRDD